MRSAAISWRCQAACIVMVGLAGCAVGPDFKAPRAPPYVALPAAALPPDTTSVSVPGGNAQHFELGADVPARWWQGFGSTKLNALVDAALAKYPEIDAQQAALHAAREAVRAQQGVFYPQLSGSASGQRERVSGAAIAPGFPGYTTSSYQTNVNVTYAFDLFGGERRAVEGLRAAAENQQFELEASVLSLTSNVVSTAMQVAVAQDQLAATNELIALEQRQLEVTERQFQLGSRTRADVLQQQSHLAGVRTGLPDLQQQLAVAEHALAVLTGRTPAEAGDVELTLADLTLPSELPVTLPSTLVVQRPDIRAEQAALHQASAAIGVATSNMLPQLTLSGALGGQSPLLQDVLEPQSGVWNTALGLSQPLFEGGTLRARRREAVDNYAQLAARYRLVVLQAFQNVADALSALDNDAQKLKAEFDALGAAQASLDLTQRQYDDGAADYVALLTQQQLYQQARVGYVLALGTRYRDTVGLFQALGGGWWHRDDVDATPSTVAQSAPSATQPATP